MRTNMCIAAAALLVCSSAGRTPILTIDDVLASTLPTLFNTPSIDVKPDGGADSGSGRRVRRLAVTEDGTYPDVVSAGAHEQITDHGWIALNYNVLLLNTTVAVEQYTDVFTAEGVQVECKAQDAAYVDDDSVVQRTTVVLMVTAPNAALPAMADAVSHMHSRLVAGNIMVLGPHLMAALPSFHRGGSCAAAIPATSPYYQIVAVGEEPSTDGLGTDFIYGLTPVDMNAVFGWTHVEFEWDPKPEREVARRRELGLSLPADVDAQLGAFHARRLARQDAASLTETPGARKLPFNFDKTIELLNINYDPETKTAKTRKIDILPNDVLYLEDAYVFFTVKVTFKLEACVQITGLVNRRVYYYDMNGDFTNYEGYYTGGPTSLPMPPDCAALKTRLPASVSGSELSPRDPYVFNVAFKAEASIKGDIGFNFKVKSDGVKRQTTCARSTDFDYTQASCAKEFIPPFKLPPITVALLGIPISITPSISMKIGGSSTVDVPGKFQAGAFFNAGASASGSIRLYGTNADELAATTASFDSAYYANWGLHPFIYEGFKIGTGTAAVRLWPTLTLSLYDVIPVYTSLAVDTGLDIVHSTSGARQLRALQSTPAILPECTRVGGSYDTEYEAAGVSGVSSVTARSLLDGLTGQRSTKPFISKDTMDRFWYYAGTSVANTVMIEGTESPSFKLAEETTIASGCSKPNEGAVPSPSPSSVPAGLTPARVSGKISFAGLPASTASSKAMQVLAALKTGIANLARVAEKDVEVGQARRRLAEDGGESAFSRELQTQTTYNFAVTSNTQANADALKATLAAVTPTTSTMQNIAYRVATAAGVAVSTLTPTLASLTVSAPGAPLVSISGGGGSGGTSSGTSSTALAGGAIAGIIIGILIAVGLIAGGAFFVHRSKAAAAAPKASPDAMTVRTVDNPVVVVQAGEASTGTTTTGTAQPVPVSDPTPAVKEDAAEKAEGTAKEGASEQAPQAATATMTPPAV